MRFSKLRKLSRHVAGVQGESLNLPAKFFQMPGTMSRSCMYFSRHVTCPPRLEDTASVGGLQPTLPPQPLFQADKALVADDQVIDQLDVQVLARGD